jgi:hypothetical protein
LPQFRSKDFDFNDNFPLGIDAEFKTDVTSEKEDVKREKLTD